ncbi:hypothetical protein ACIPSA_42980 [Streptomyces sp. NPDC086549]|uniref:hypothetical protein n=1 Tax=Streptomyces sp. NPDC086549 TaxID=3365752 RepID=UPI0038134B39
MAIPGQREANRPGFEWRHPSPGRIPITAAPRKYSAQLREGATRLAVEARKDPDARAGAVKRAETDEGARPGTTSQDAARIAELEREVKELRRANTILKSALPFFAAELDRPLR